LKFKWFIHNKLILLFNRYLIRKGCESLSSTFCSHDFFQDFSLIINSRTFVLFYPDYWNCLVPCYLFKWGSVTEIEIVNLCSLMKPTWPFESSWIKGLFVWFIFGNCDISYYFYFSVSNIISLNFTKQLYTMEWVWFAQLPHKIKGAYQRMA
jgi:hypothetical protein